MARSSAMYARDVAAYLVFAGSREAALNATTLARWRTHLAQATAMSTNTINRMLAATKRLMKEAAEQGYQTVAAWDSSRPVGSDYTFARCDGRGRESEGTRASALPLSRKSIWQIVRRHAEEAGLDQVKTHDLRCFVGTQLARVDIRKA